MEAPLLPSVLKVPPAARSQERVSKDTENLSPITGDTGSFVLYLSVQGGGLSAHLSPGRPPSPQPSLLHREQVLLSASSVPSWCPGLRQGDLARVGDSMDAEPHSPAWEQQHCWHQGGNLAAVSVVLSPKLSVHGVSNPG